MDNDLFKFFPSFQFLDEYPTELEEGVHLFHNSHTNNWFKISKTEVSKRDYALFSTLFSEVKLPFLHKSISRKWRSFLEFGGHSPIKEGTEIRIIQLYFKENNMNEADLSKASNAFFGESMQLVFISSQNALLIEQKSYSIHTVEHFSSFLTALESDFYTRTKIYVGQFRLADSLFPNHFTMEKEWFIKAMSYNGATQIHTMANTFPFHLIEQMSENMKNTLTKEVLIPLGYDIEILQTVRYFFENGLNASVAAKKLFIHRNTLQYRLNKFQENTGISLRSFDGALVAYCASLIATYK